MTRCHIRQVLVAPLVLAVLSVLHTPSSFAQNDELRPGFHGQVFAIEGGQVIAEPGRVLEQATVVLRDGAIVAVGPAGEVDIPPEAERIDATGMFVYPGFIDAYTTEGVDAKAERSSTGSGRSIDYSSFALAATPPDNRSGLTPEFEVAEALSLEEKTTEALRAEGFTAMLSAPSGGIAVGQSALASLSGLPRREIILASPVAMHIALTSPAARGYPSTLMGCVAHLRQAMLDATHYENQWNHFREHGGGRPPHDPTLEALRAVQRRDQQVFWQADTRDEIHRALDLADEFGVRVVIVGGQEAWKVADRLAAAEVPVVLQINFPEEPKAGSAAKKVDPLLAEYSLEQLKEGLKRDDLPEGIRERIQARIDELTKPEESEGDKKPDEDKKADEKKADDKYRLPDSPRVLAEKKRLWEQRVDCAKVLVEKGVTVSLCTEGHSKPSEFAAHLRAMVERGLPADAALAALTTNPASLMKVSENLGQVSPGYLAHVVVFDKPFTDEKAKLRFSFVDTEKFELNKPKPEEESKAEDKDSDDKKETSEETNEEDAESQEKTDEKPDDAELAEAETESEQESPELIDVEPYPTEIEADRKPATHTGGNAVIRNATVLTVTQGTLTDASILIRDGKIAALGTDIETPAGFVEIDATGLYIMPGIIDCHVHFAITRGINESTVSVTPEVRIRDVIDGDDLTIYRSLAGGVTCARVLHGSANAIGGQDAVIKLRWGQPGSELILRDAPRGVKFALGENPKRSSQRFPDTRLGVESTIRRSFDEGLMYRRLWQAYAEAKSRGENPPEPRRDLRLEALADMLESRLRIHSHCYRADEILMLLRMAESYGIRIRSLQHVLEGYKIAPEIAAHGASCSAFADWWAYKIEAYDAIPFNTPLLIEAGASVTLKSDDNELGRHLYQEAAKMLKYGTLTEDEALALVTINGAKQLGLEDRIGSIEVGKAADLAIFNGHPLNGFSRCEMTLVDGEVYFERDGNHEPAGYETPLPADELRTRSLAVEESPTGSYLLTGGKIFPVDGEPIEGGSILVVDGQIQAIGSSELQAPQGTVTVDLAGLSVYPGMINAGGALGLVEIGSIRETHDYSEAGDFNADLRASVAVHADSELIPVTRVNGILAVLSQPTGGVISGQSVLMNLHGWIPPEMALVDPAALHVNFPTGRYRDGGTKTTEAQKKAIEEIDALKEQFRRALKYAELRQRADEDNRPGPAPDPHLEALAPYAAGEKLVVLHASRHGDILAAIDFAEEMQLDWILSDAADAWKCVPALKEHNVRVILGPSMQLPGDEFEPYDAPYANAARLHEAGVPFAIKAVDSGPGSATSGRNLPFQAAMAASYGLPVEEALKAVTLYPAKILGVDDQVGSIGVGKVANLVITDGNLLQPATRVKWLFIAGRPVAPESKHTQLYAQYRRRLQEVQAGKVMLGVQASEAEEASSEAAGQ